MLHIGCHLSIAKGFLHMGEEALSIQADTFQFFTRNPRGGSAKAVNPDDAAALRALLSAHHFAPLLGHAPYTLNACSKDPALRDFAARVISDDLKLMEMFPGCAYNFHPGSHVGQGIEKGIALIGDVLNKTLDAACSTRVLLETMSGKGSEVGGTFEELREIIDRVEKNGSLGVCLDTCHVSDAGYDIVRDLDGVLTHFDAVIGLERLSAVHLNDSLNPCGSRKDRHARLGEGSIGLEALTRFINHEALRNLPFYLETPNDIPGYAAEIRLMRERFREADSL